MDTIWAVVAIVVGALYGAGVALGGSAANAGFAKATFLTSGGLLGLWCFYWQFATDASMSVRVIIGALIGAFIFVAIPETNRRVVGAEESKEMPAHSEPAQNKMGGITGNSGIVSQGQSGDNTITK